MSTKGIVSRPGALLPGFLMLSILGATVALSGGTSAKSASVQLPAPRAHISVNGHSVHSVRYHGRLVSLEHYLNKVEPAAAQSQSYLNLMIDRSAIRRGYFVAFSHRGAAKRYMNAHGMTPQSSTGRNHVAFLNPGSSSDMTLGGMPVTLAACVTSGFKFAVFYDGLSCTGSSLSMIANDAIPHFGTYGFTDKTSSLDVGYCISNVHVWKDGGYSPAPGTTFGGGTYYNAMPAGWNDVISSAKTDSSGAC